MKYFDRHSKDKIAIRQALQRYFACLEQQLDHNKRAKTKNERTKTKNGHQTLMTVTV